MMYFRISLQYIFLSSFQNVITNVSEFIKEEQRTNNVGQLQFIIFTATSYVGGSSYRGGEADLAALEVREARLRT